jgi:hypothetical protein
MSTLTGKVAIDGGLTAHFPTYAEELAATTIFESAGSVIHP